MSDQRFKPTFRVDGRWIVRDTETDVSVMPACFEIDGLVFEDAAVLACFLNNLLERENEEPPGTVQ